MTERPGAAQLDRLQRALNHRFADERLLIRALTHKSVSPNGSNERLEYLGDAVLGYVVAAHLHRQHPGEAESGLTLARAALVKQGTLAEIGRALALGDHMRFGIGEMRSGAFRRASVLANGVEALIGAVHEDGGVEAARALVVHLLGDRLTGLRPAPVKDAKSALQEFAQARAMPLPAYRIVEEAGVRHAPRFIVSCEVAELGLKATAEGASRKEAEKRAAAELLDRIEADAEGG